MIRLPTCYEIEALYQRGTALYMELTVTLAGKAYRVDLDRPLSLAIPLRFDGVQPNFFDAPQATSRSLMSGDCNVAEISLVPHCNGTHTETAGHVLDTDYPVNDALAQSLIPALLISVTPVADGDDRVIPRDSLDRVLSGGAADEQMALIIRTLPNDAAKKTMVYGSGRPPPFFSEDAMHDLADRAITHLLVDIPSVDRMHDEGRLANHRIFWKLAAGAREAAPDTRLDRSITEMIYVADDIADGLYLLNLQAPAFATHAAPSRPVIYPLNEFTP